jgi:Mg2+ and Co2+ transporter CorA
MAEQDLHSTARQLDQARDNYRTALSLAAAINTSQQLELQARNHEQGRAFERTVALLGSIVLVPGLVATFYGANVRLPGRGTWWGTDLLVALMVVAGCTTWLLLRGLARRRT